MDFAWTGTLSVEEGARACRFAFEGQALRDMEVCRVGLVLLHPVESLIGSTLTAKSPDSTEQRLVGEDIAPQPIIAGVPSGMTEPFTELRIEREDFGTLKLEFAGDLFEIEDQRNWGDASFKTYCTPLRRGFPFLLKAGTRIAQSVQVHFVPAVTSGRLNGRRFPQPEGRRETSQHVFPSLGRELEKSAATTRADGRELSWRHWRVEGDDTSGWARLEQVFLRSQDIPIELAISSREGERPPPELLVLVGRQGTRIARLMVSGARGALPSAQAMTAWRDELKALGLAHLPLFAEVRGYYAELNRERLPRDLNGDGVAFPLSATVHGDDPALIADNIGAILAMADTVRQRLSVSNLALSPLALHYPRVTTPSFPRELITAWFTAMLIEAGHAGIASITVADDVIHGIASEMGSLRFFERMLECARWDIEVLVVQTLAHVHIAVLRDSAQGLRRLLISNLSNSSVVLALDTYASGEVEMENLCTGGVARANAGHLDIPTVTAVWVNT